MRRREAGLRRWLAAVVASPSARRSSCVRRFLDPRAEAGAFAFAEPRTRDDAVTFAPSSPRNDRDDEFRERRCVEAAARGCRRAEAAARALRTLMEAADEASRQHADALGDLAAAFDGPGAFDEFREARRPWARAADAGAAVAADSLRRKALTDALDDVGDARAAARSFCGRVAATPWLRRGYFVEASRRRRGRE